MKAVILAGGRGTRLGEETELRPKPMVEIGGHPILWHIMKIYAQHGITDFVVLVGYRGYMIKEYFSSYLLHNTDVTFDLGRGTTAWHGAAGEDWRVTLVDTGGETMTGGRLKRAAPYLENEEAFCLTYGDGLADVDIGAEIDFHRKHRRLATMTVIPAPSRFGAAELDGDRVVRFLEKPLKTGTEINGGFLVLSPKVLEMIAGDDTILEQDTFAALSRAGELLAWRHHGFWQPMDTPRDRDELRGHWESGRAPWVIWE